MPREPIPCEGAGFFRAVAEQGVARAGDRRDLRSGRARREARESLGVRTGAAAVPSPGGCPFRLRCPLATDLCATERPALRQVGGSAVACHYA